MTTHAPFRVSPPSGLPVLAVFYRDGEPGPRVVMSDPFVCRELAPGHPSYSMLAPDREEHAGRSLVRVFNVEHGCPVTGFEDHDVAALYFAVPDDAEVERADEVGRN